jgi:hypothetical protein
MPNYRRAFAPGGCWFFTVNLLDRRSSLLTDEIETRVRLAALIPFTAMCGREFSQKIGPVRWMSQAHSESAMRRDDVTDADGAIRFAIAPYAITIAFAG